MFKTTLILAGLAQIAIALSSLAIPALLGWREETRRLQPLTRQVFWVYSAYIFATNLALGILTVSVPGALLDGSALAAAVTAFISLYWTARLVLQFVLYDREAAGGRVLFRIAEVLYVTGFAFVAITNGMAAVHNL